MSVVPRVLPPVGIRGLPLGSLNVVRRFGISQFCALAELVNVRGFCDRDEGACNDGGVVWHIGAKILLYCRHDEERGVGRRRENKVSFEATMMRSWLDGIDLSVCPAI